MTTIGTRIRNARRDANISQEELARRVGVSQGAIGHLESGRTRNTHLLVRIASTLGVSAEWLETGTEPVNKTVASENELLQVPTDDEFALVPQLDIAAACGEGTFVDHIVVKGGLAFKRSSLRDFGVPEYAARIIYSSGGSMAPTIQDGRVVLINTADREPRDGKVFAICKPDSELVLKRLVWDYHPSIGAQVWIMRSDNPDKNEHPDKILPPDDRTMIVGRAVWNDNRL